MKVLHLCTFRTGGAGIAARRIHEAVMSAGVESRLIYRDDVPGIIPPFRRRTLCPVFRGLRKAMDIYYDLFRHPGCYGHSESLFPFASIREINSSDADVIHLHWINGDFLSIGQFAAIRKPVVWTLHDNWAYCGNEFCTEHFRYRDGYTVSTRPEQETGPDLARFIWNCKKRKWKNLHPVFVSPSQWNADRLSESLLFRGSSCAVIRNPLDLQIFSPGDKTRAKRQFGLDPECPVLLFGAENINNPLKGQDLLLAALKILAGKMPAERLQLLCFGSGKPEIPQDLPYPVIHAGVQKDEIQMVSLYNAADMLVCPSRMDNYPGVCTEAMACGVPAAAFRTAGLPEIISDPDSLAEPFSPESLAGAILHTLEHRAEQGIGARQYAEKNCDPAFCGTQSLKVYEQVQR